MAYSKQTFTANQVLTSTHMNQVEDNIEDHVHGSGGISATAGPMTITSVNSLVISAPALLSSIGIGTDALASSPTTATGVVAIGHTACNSLVGGDYITAIGQETLQVNSGVGNHAIGAFAGKSLSVGYDNIFVGNSCGTVVSSGYRNILVGNRTGQAMTSGYSNVSMGHDALSSITTGNRNVCIGDEAAKTGTGAVNVVIGHASASSLTTGQQNVVIGAYASQALTTGTYNVSVGYLAGAGYKSGTHNTAVGHSTLSSVNSFVNCSGLGNQADVTGSNQVQLGNSSTTTYAYGTVQNRSDERDKYNIEPTEIGLDFINKLNPVSYLWNYREDYIEGDAPLSHVRKRKHQGLIAQEVEVVCKNLGIDFGGLQHHEKAGGKDVYSLGYSELIAPLIKAVQELTQRVEQLEKG